MDKLHQCDRCAAKAYVEVYALLPDGKVIYLQFCAHHYRSHEARLAVSGWKINRDERHELMPTQAATSA
jgi:hypothetical protein